MHEGVAVKISTVITCFYLCSLSDSWNIDMDFVHNETLKGLFIDNAGFHFSCQDTSSILESLETHMNGLEDAKGGKKG